jgi:glycosyltransferase involved in cell wall biosynthesis
MKDYSKHVLFVGPHFDLKGGIAAVLKVYHMHFKQFNFLPTCTEGGGIASVFYFVKAKIKFVWWMLSRRDIKIVHIHSSFRGSFTRKSMLLLIAKFFGKKTIFHIHAGGFKMFYEGSSKVKQRYIRYILNLTDELATLSPEWKFFFDSITKKPKAIVLNNPVNIPASTKPNTLEIPVQVLYLNHITKDKGIFDIIELFIQNKESFKGVFKLTIAGSGSGLDKMKAMIAENSLENLIEYKGWVSGKEKEELTEGCNLFILTSYYEGLPMSILETMAYSKPVIATNVGGIANVVKPGQNGWLIAPGDIAGLKKIFEEIKTNPAVLEGYGESSFKIVQDYSIVKLVEKLNGIYERLLQNGAIKQQAALYEEAK